MLMLNLQKKSLQPYFAIHVGIIRLNQFMDTLSVQAARCLQSAAKVPQPMPKRIGIYSGTFDPVHAGHIVFALQSVKAASLDLVYFLPERRPSKKQHVEHFAHRVAMIKQAIKPHPKFKVIELVDISFSIERTLPKLIQKFKDSELVFLFGSDTIKDLPSWPNVDRLLTNHEIVIGLRGKDKKSKLKQFVESWTTQPKSVTIFDSYAPNVSSGKIREALRLRRKTAGTLKSVERYSDRNWLYVSVA
jgi:nicotinate (nicotinamide) nucleotide adenylyltransferase